MAPVLENMWLTATEKGLGFQLVSSVGQMSKNKEFLDFLRLKKGGYDIEGCIIGVPLKKSDKEKNFNIEQCISWID